MSLVILEKEYKPFASVTVDKSGAESGVVDAYKFTVQPGTPDSEKLKNVKDQKLLFDRIHFLN